MTFSLQWTYCTVAFITKCDRVISSRSWCPWRCLLPKTDDRKCIVSEAVVQWLGFCQFRNIAVSYDGTPIMHRHSSLIRVGTIIELFSGLVLDYVALSNFCAGCARGWNLVTQITYESHLWQKKKKKKAGEMEVEAALVLFERSLQLHKLRYTTILSDCHSRSFLALNKPNYTILFLSRKKTAWTTCRKGWPPLCAQ